MFKKKKYKSNSSSIDVIGSIGGPRAVFIAKKEMDKEKSKLGVETGFFRKYLNTIKFIGKW